MKKQDLICTLFACFFLFKIEKNVQLQIWFREQLIVALREVFDLYKINNGPSTLRSFS